MSNDSDSIRLNKYLALHAGISRREADEFIDKNQVTINGQIAKIGVQVSPGDEVRLRGNLIDDSTSMEYLLFHKPVGYVCSRRAQGSDPTIYDIIPGKYHSLKTVGRLDRDSSGLILLTNDGDFSQSMTHPRYAKVKRYNVLLDKPLEPLHQQMIADIGVNLDDGQSQLGLERMDDSRANWIVTMSEGRNRQIRRTFSALGYVVSKLHRTDFGPYTIGELAPGQIKIASKL